MPDGRLTSWSIISIASFNAQPHAPATSDVPRCSRFVVVPSRFCRPAVCGVGSLAHSQGVASPPLRPRLFRKGESEVPSADHDSGCVETDVRLEVESGSEARSADHQFLACEKPWADTPFDGQRPGLDTRHEFALAVRNHRQAGHLTLPLGGSRSQPRGGFAWAAR